MDWLSNGRSAARARFVWWCPVALPRLFVWGQLFVWGLLSACTGGRSAGDTASGPSSRDGETIAGTSGDAGVGDGGWVALGPDMEFVSMDTLAPAEVVAGARIPVLCSGTDAAGEVGVVAPEDREVFVSPAAAVDVDPAGVIRARRSAGIEVACRSVSLGLIDETPAFVQVLPASPATLTTTLDRTLIVAGDQVQATCSAEDRFGNPLPTTPAALRVTPSDGVSELLGLSVRMTRTGLYSVGCQLPGAITRPVQVEVLPGLAAGISVSRVPEEEVYGIGQVVQVVSLVVDAFGNEVPGAQVQLSVDPAGQALGDSRLRFDSEGRFEVTARVQDPSQEGEGLVATTTLVVDGTGPAIRCGIGPAFRGPLDGEMVDAEPGTILQFTGSVSDAAGLASVTVNDQPAELDEDGNFAVPFETRFGLNVARVVAVDRFGIENTRGCAFLAAGNWVGEDAVLPDAVTLDLTERAVDDADRSGEVDSLNDLLDAAINSDGLRETLHASLLASNPLKPSSCDQSLPLIGCVLRSEIHYLDSVFAGPNDSTLGVIEGGLRASVTFRDVRLKLDVDGTFDTTGWAEFEWFRVDLDFDARLQAGRPAITVRDGSVQVSIGDVDTDFSGVSGFFLDIVLALVEGTLKDMVADMIQGYVQDSFNDILDGVVSGLDIRSLGSSFAVPRLGDGDPISLSFGVDFSSLVAGAGRLSFGIGTRFGSTPLVAFPSLGVPLPPGAVRDDAAGAEGALLSVHVGVFNQVLHSLWRAGLLEAKLGGSAGAVQLPEGVQIKLSASLPPVARLRDDGRTGLDLGPLRVELRYPGLLDEALVLWLAARARTEVTLQGSDLGFSGMEIEELFFSTQQTSLDQDTRDVLEGVLRSLVDGLVGSALNDALPAIPIPSFALPDSVSEYDLPAGQELGLVDPRLSMEDPHFVLRAGFGVK